MAITIIGFVDIILSLIINKVVLNEFRQKKLSPTAQYSNTHFSSNCNPVILCVQRKNTKIKTTTMFQCSIVTANPNIMKKYIICSYQQRSILWFSSLLCPRAVLRVVSNNAIQHYTMSWLKRLHSQFRWLWLWIWTTNKMSECTVRKRHKLWQC